MDPHRYNRHSMFLRKDSKEDSEERQQQELDRLVSCANCHFTLIPLYFHPLSPEQAKTHTEEDVGLLVQVGFDITAFTPPAYQRGSLPRPSKDVSS